MRIVVTGSAGTLGAPLVVIEATLAGCEVVTNSLVGRLEPGDPAQVLSEQPKKFWRIVEETA